MLNEKSNAKIHASTFHLDNMGAEIQPEKDAKHT